MWHSRYIGILVAFLLVCGCKPTRMVMDFKEQDINKEFFADLDIVGDSVAIYKTSFSTKYVENTGILEFSMINDKDAGQAFRYADVDGDKQDLYIMRITGGTQTQYLYFSARYALFEGDVAYHCKGFGPAYLGSYDGGDVVINFPKTVVVTKGGNKRIKRPNKNNTVPVFILKKPIGSSNIKDTIQVTKIMFGGYNKFGGSRPIVTPVQSLLKNIDGLYFHHVTTKSIH